MTTQYEIENANDVVLTVTPVFDGDSLNLEEAARIVADSFNFTINEDNQSLSGAGRRTPKGLSGGDVEYTFSFTIQGTSAELLKTFALRDGRSRWIAFTAVCQDGTILDMDAGKFTSFAKDGSSGDPTEYSIEGVAVKFQFRNVAGIKSEDE